MAGTGNFKRDYKANFPTVAIEEANPGPIVTPTQLESMGLAAPAQPKPKLPAPPFDVLTGRVASRGRVMTCAWKERSQGPKMQQSRLHLLLHRH